ncbi:type II CRISPR RNA-guided endonuclease Cas9 [Pedobacter sp. SL55]|uniref:type II CRISPR RNA-guided endonuclease Cas9 n=1 Tax=Pedobacter sp. SL55 TaxID=2995161 RepID=UPI002271B489|nr:type II CRISPR RNA-guided endonuclease Cas9 [Pedobacter sp. SL55]WAC39284.1 type II CRISPR RNA-guided endonuclease Cas9 [Pedobacter sp. SL55]
MAKNILGLDLGTNSIGWALIKQDFENKHGEILGMGSRIIPMSQDILGDFGKGNSVSQTADRTKYRSVRRLRERFLLRRERLHRVLSVLNFLPEHYASQIDFEKRFGKFKVETEPKLAWKKIEGQFSFLFQNSFNEMLEGFKAAGQDLKIPYDWTIYYLRKKALYQKIEKEELAWILLNFNQKRGYYQLRGEEEEENPNKLVEFYSLKIIDVLADEPQKRKSDIWYSLILENGWVYRRASKIPLFDWKDKTRDFIVTTDLNDDGSIKKDKDGNEKRSFRAPSENDWTLVKKKTEQEIDQSYKTVGTYIYETLLQNPKQKIKGKLVRTIERKFYKDEIRQILEKQKEFHQELKNDDLYNDCVRALYRNNEAHQLTLSKKDFVHLLMDDLIFYQRPLRSQKSSISNCTLEFRKYKDENGAEHTQYLKAIPKSNPYYQEFRLWQWIYNLNIYRKDNEANVTKEFLNTTEDFENLFEFLNARKEVDQKALLKHFKLNEKTHRWNFVEDKKYPCNETKTMISSRLDKVENISDDFLTREIEQKIWHIIYSVNDKIEYEKALKSFANKNSLDENSFFEAFKKFPPFKSEYGSFSEKAIKKLLPLMRLGKYWNYENIDAYSKDRIQKIITGEFDENIKNKVREKAIHLTQENDFQGLQLWLAQYIVYGRHSEASMIGKWNSADDLEEFLKDFKQHSLRNPIVEQVITETLRVVKDIWLKYGNGAKDFFNEIHIELGREMKLPADDRKKLTNQITENENTNFRIKALLAEMMNDSSVENVRPFSPMQQEILKIYEDGVLNSDIEIEDDILKISKTAQPSLSDLKRYKLWLEQKYKSPYTGQIIPLNKLFTPEYEIEHIIPQSRYFDDSFSNKVICESAVNKLKDNYIGFEFIKKLGGTVVECGKGKSVTVLKEDEYEDFVKKNYANNRGKRNKLLMEDIPEKMIERQMNDTRYISKYISEVLSNIVRVDDGSDEGVNSKNIVPGNGKITNTLKQDWGLNDVWNDLILPRFERMNQLTNSADFTAWNENHQKFLPTVPIEYSKGFSKKRIDHRHHALDALIIACATKDHVNLLNNQSAKSDTKRYDLKKKLMKFEKVVYNDAKTGERIEREVPKQFLKPWINFTAEAKNSLEKIVVSFKQNLRVINKATNYYEKYIERDGVKTKERAEQKGTNWAIRKSLHEETVSGKIHLPWVETGKGEFITATRKSLDTSFNLDKIKKVTDTGIQKILKNYLEAKDNNPELAFSPEGIEDLNKNVEKYNEGKPHQPIIKVRVYEKGKGRFALGQTGNKIDKYVQGSPNLFFAIYKDEDRKKSFDSIRLDIVIERMKQMLSPVPEINNNGDRLCETLSPLDVVYIPTEEESENIDIIDFNTINKSKLERIYNVNDFSGYTIYFSQNSFAKNIFPKEMDLSWNVKKGKASGSFDSKTASFNGKSIKDNFVKLNIDRLGSITKA